MCRLPPQSVALIAVGSIALVIAIVGSILVFMYWLSRFYDKGESVAPIKIITWDSMLSLMCTVVSKIAPTHERAPTPYFRVMGPSSI